MRGSLLCILLALTVACAPASRTPPADETIRRGLLTRAAAQQALQDTFMASRRVPQGPVDTAFLRRFDALDSANTAWLAEVMPATGWFREADVGVDGVAAAFQLLRSATDSSLQVRALPRLRDAVARGEVPAKDYAILSDRVATRRGLAQEFGTQTVLRDGRTEFLPIADSAGVDARRAAVGLGPLRDYVRYLDSLNRAGS